MTVDKDIVHRDVYQQPDKANYHAGFGFRQSFTLVTRHLEEQVTGRAPQQRTQIADGFIGQGRVDIVHRANNMARVPQHNHDQNGDTSGEPEALTYLMGNTIASA
ncbi:hypothetical protein D3C72_1222980 [compost metagenome]